MILNIFNNTIIVGHCSETLYKNEELELAITKVFNMPNLMNYDKDEYWDSVVGNSITTENDQFVGPLMLPGSNMLTHWITEQVNSYAKEFGITKELVIDKNWMNKNFKGSQTRCHKHISDLNDRGTNSALVALLYYNNNVNGARLGICKEGPAAGKQGLAPSEMPKSNIEYINDCSTGVFIIHDGNCFHAVEEHLIDEPRIVFVYHFVIKD
jgi:hypothetical protein